MFKCIKSTEGSVINFTWRVITALLSKESEYVKWPTSGTERRTISKRIKDHSGFPNCVGFVDGTLIVFENCPEMHGVEFFSHKGRYVSRTEAY